MVGFLGNCCVQGPVSAWAGAGQVNEPTRRRSRRNSIYFKPETDVNRKVFRKMGPKRTAGPEPRGSAFGSIKCHKAPGSKEVVMQSAS